MTVLEQVPEGARVAVIRLRSLGDCVLTTPALQLLKSFRPDLKIGVAVEERFAAVFDRSTTAEVLPPTCRAVRGYKPALCVNLHGGTRSVVMTALSGAKWRAGFAHHRGAFNYNFKIPRAQRILGVNRIVHTAEHLASAFFALGVPVQPIPAAQLFPGDPPLRLHERYAVLHPFASAPEKRWPAERFCELARYLKLWNVRPVIIAGPRDDAEPFRAHQVFRGTLSEAIALISKAVLFAGNDSGPAHVAAAFGIPSLVLFSTSNPAIWGPWRTQSQVIAASEGLQNVSASRVIAALERLRIFQGAHA